MPKNRVSRPHWSDGPEYPAPRLNGLDTRRPGIGADATTAGHMGCCKNHTRGGEPGNRAPQPRRHRAPHLAAAYVNHPRGASFRNGGLVVSSIYVWFQEDFGDSEAGAIAHLRAHAEPALARRLAGRDSLFDDRYDWTLNDTGSGA
jgi:hypothetical protein